MRRKDRPISSPARKDLERLKRLVDEMTEHRTLGDHARFGVFLQRYAKILVEAVREKALEIMEENNTDTLKDDGVRFYKQPSNGAGSKPAIHIEIKEKL